MSASGHGGGGRRDAWICGLASMAATAAATSSSPTASSGPKRRRPVMSPRVSSAEPGELFGTAEHVVQHGWRQPAGKGVLLADVVTA